MNRARELQALEDFEHSPFPLRRNCDPHGRPFFDQRDGARRGRTTRHGEICWEDESYSSRQVLLHVLANFNAHAPVTLVVYLHGNRARLERDVIVRQQVPRQVGAAAINAVLVAPQLALDAPDSSAGRFAVRGMFRRFLNEAAQRLAALCHARHAAPAKIFESARVILVAYSGGYCPAAAALTRGGVRGRIRGVVLLDALYDHEALFADTLTAKAAPAFVVSAYTHSTRARNLRLRELLKEHKHTHTLGLTRSLAPGSACLVPLDGAVDHADVMTRAWCDDPLSDVLRRAGPDDRSTA